MKVLESTLLWLVLALAGGAASVWVERDALAVGLPLHLRVEADSREAAEAMADGVLASLAALEGRVATWRSDSELARLNRAPVGEPRPVSDTLFALLSDTWNLSAATNRAFDPGIGALLAAWTEDPWTEDPWGGGRARSLRSSGRGCFDLRPATTSISRDCEGASMDSRGFARGAAIALAADVLEGAGARSARIDLGGQHLALGEAVYSVELGDPANPARSAFRLSLAAGTLASAGSVRRDADGSDGPPDLDPRTGRPVAAWGSVWVRSDDPLAADILAGALFVMGPDAASRWLVARPEVEAILIVGTDEGPVACGAIASVSRLTPLSPRARASARHVSDGVLACPTPISPAAATTAPDSAESDERHER